MRARPAFAAGCRPTRGSRAVSCRRSRVYDPTTGTFLSPDPLDGVDGTPTVANPYHYADNDPLNKVDPLGLRPSECEFNAQRVMDSDHLGYLSSLAIVVGIERHDGCILDFVDQNGDCCLVAAYGDVDRAQNIAIVLEGTGQNLKGFNRGVGTKARVLRDAAGDVGGGSTAVIAWLGYDSPNSFWTGYQKGPARTGGAALADFVDALRSRVRGGTRITAIGHSYGSVVVGEAMSNGMDADAAIITGSPGINASSVAVTGFGGPLYVGCAPGDNIDWVPERVHGVDPCLKRAFSGAEYFDVSGSSGHNEYFRRGSVSLASMAAIVTGTARKGENGLWGAP